MPPPAMMIGRSLVLLAMSTRYVRTHPSASLSISAIRTAQSCVKPHVDVLGLREFEELVDRFLAADAGLLVAAEWRAQEMHAGVVDPHEPGLHAACCAMRGH